MSNLTGLNEKLLEEAVEVAAAKLRASAVVFDKLSKQEVALLFNFQACVEAAIKYYAEEIAKEAR